MKKTISIIFAVALMFCFAIPVSAVVQPLLYWNDTVYKIDVIKELREDEYAKAIYNENELIVVGEIDHILPEQYDFTTKRNGTANFWFEVGSKIYYRSSDKELFVTYVVGEKELFRHIIPLSQDDDSYCFDPAPVDISLGAGIEEPVLA